MENVYWTMRNGQKINVDDMDINHLRNTLKMILRNRKVVEVKPKPKFQVHGEIAGEFADRVMMYNISPELTCACDEVHMCQQCAEGY